MTTASHRRTVGSAIRSYRHYLSRYVFPHRREVGLLSLALFAATGLQFASPLIQGRFIDGARAGQPMSTLLVLGVLALVTAAFGQAVSVTETYVAQRLGWRATNQLRDDLLVHTLRLDLSFFGSHTPGELIERIDGDVLLLANFFSRFVVYIVGNGLMIVLVLALFWKVDWRVGLAMTLLVVTATALIFAVRTLAPKYVEAGREASAAAMGFILEHLAGAEDLRANGAVEYVLWRFAGYARNLFRRRRVADVMATPTNWVLFFASYGGLALALGFGGYLFLHGAISLGTAYALVAYAQVLDRPFELLSLNLQDLQQATAGLTRVNWLLSQRPRIVDGPGVAIPAGACSVEFDQVSFSYEAGTPTLLDVSFRVPAGSVIGLLGRTGSGKTTVSRLLSRLYDPDTGIMRFGGVDIRETRVADLRKHVSAVTQDVQFFHATLRDNLTLFDQDVSDDRIEHALTEVGLFDWFRSLPLGLDTMLAGGSAGLSAGQSQLLAFARVFLQDPGLIILDEASSRLDPVTERLIERAVDRLLAGRTAVVIAHRLRALHRADQILVMQDGRVVEQGARTDLERDPNSRYAEALRLGMEDVLS